MSAYAPPIRRAKITIVPNQFVGSSSIGGAVVRGGGRGGEGGV